MKFSAIFATTIMLASAPAFGQSEVEEQPLEMVSAQAPLQAIVAEPGWHTLTLVDDLGFRLRHRFKVLGK